MGSIYVIVMVKPSNPLQTRSYGYFFTRERAEEVVLNNWCDVFESGNFTHAVIEETPEGITANSQEVGWYRFDSVNNKSIHCKKPKGLRGIVMFGIG